MKDYIRQFAMKSKDVDIRKINDAVNTAYVFLTFGNDIASGAMVDARDSIKASGYYKKECKQYMNKAFKEYDNFEMALKDLDITTFYNLMACADKLQDYISNDVYLLKMSFKNYLDKFSIAQSDMLANIHVARVLLDRAVKAYGEYFKSVNNQIGYDISPYMEVFRIDGAFKWWNEMSEYITNKVDNTDLIINFNEDVNCRLAVKVINDKLSDFNKLNDIIIEGLEEDSYGEQK